MNSIICFALNVVSVANRLSLEFVLTFHFYAGACTVFILLASENLHSLIPLDLTSISDKNEYRIWLVICTAVLLPLTWLGTPKNFWPVALFAIIATSVACLLIVIKIGVDFDGVAKTRHVTATSFFSGVKCF